MKPNQAEQHATALHDQAILSNTKFHDLTKLNATLRNDLTLRH